MVLEKMLMYVITNMTIFITDMNNSLCHIVADSICLMENWIRYQRNFYFSSELVSRERLPRDKAAVSRVVSLRFPLILSVTHR